MYASALFMTPVAYPNWNDEPKVTTKMVMSRVAFRVVLELLVDGESSLSS